MSLSKIDKEHQKNLFLSLQENQNTIDIIKADYSNYAKLKEISEQINHLQEKAKQIIEDSIYQNELQQIVKSFKLVSGNYYYLYEKDNKKYFSLISPEEWNLNDKIFCGKYFYDYDKQFKFTQ